MRIFTRGNFAYRASRVVVGFVVAGVLRLLFATWRIRVEGANPYDARDAHAPVVFVAWHRGLVMALAMFRGRGLLAPVSRSRDGDWTSAVLHFLGFDVSLRGSSSTGGGALLRALMRAVARGRTVGLLTDGPRGPAGVVKPGALALARTTGARLCPLRFDATRGFEFASWDRALLPAPFATVTCRFLPALEAPRDADAETLKALREQLARALGPHDAKLGSTFSPDAPAPPPR